MSLYLDRRARGLCGQCGCTMLPEWPKRAACPTCREAQVESRRTAKGKRRSKRYEKKNRARRRELQRVEWRERSAECIALGRCLDCFLEAAPGRRRCTEHQEKHNAWNRAYNERKRTGAKPAPRGTPSVPREELREAFAPKHAPADKVLTAIARFDGVETRDVADVLGVPVDAGDRSYQALQTVISRLKRTGQITASKAGGGRSTYYINREVRP